MAGEEKPGHYASGYARIVIYDPVNDRIIELDPVDGTFPTITLPHHKIHEGKSFRAIIHDLDVDTGAPKYVRITTPNTSERAHFIIMVSANGGFHWDFYQDPTINAPGAAITVFNLLPILCHLSRGYIPRHQLLLPKGFLLYQGC